MAGLSISPAATVSLVESDLSALTAAADKVIRVDDGVCPYIATLSFGPATILIWITGFCFTMFWRDIGTRSTCGRRCSCFAPKRHQKASGRFVRRPPGGQSRLEFEYELVPVWRLPVEQVLTGGLGLLPLVPVCDVASGDLPDLIDRMRRRLEAETTPVESAEVWTAVRILMGLRYERGTINRLLRGVANMEESVTYQEIIDKGVDRGRVEGRIEGRVEGELRALIRQGTRRFGQPTPSVLARLNSISDLAELDRLTLLVLDASGWNELLG